jgi:hypothetical protein
MMENISRSNETRISTVVAGHGTLPQSGCEFMPNFAGATGLRTRMVKAPRIVCSRLAQH